ncbi:MAG: ribonuclease III domain-containing protein [Pseudanabaenaceae cyanobacterium SKYGB_i_bin29]|nr:putative dsRNA-binding protein [Pseudanabaenaceae cyanobacterium SKYG29]MDW8421519.1 ribonuclease III domain-containing protein [Pseudanabaenaceae cyanobacterium SKYGB_i_bin29]
MTKITPARLRELHSLLDRLPLADKERVNWELVDLALIHPSYGSENNDYLEFCGDSVIRLEVTLYLYRQHLSSLGDLTNLRNQLVSDRVLAEIADSYNLDRFILAAPEVAKSTPRLRSRLANGLEALVGALYLSTDDFSLVSPWLDRHWERLIPPLKTKPAFGNYKIALQELTQAHWKQLPEYRLVQNQPPFVAEVWIQNRCWGKGTGNSIKEAHQEAAAQALPLLQKFVQEQADAGA